MAKDNLNREIIIDAVHHLVHKGKYFSGSIKATLSAAGTLILALTTSTKSMHVVFSVSANNTGEVEFSEGDTLADETGTEVVFYNNNRKYSSLPLSTGLKDPTVSVSGTLIKSFNLGSSNSPSSRIGGESRQQAEFVLKKNSIYTVTFTADNSSTRTTINCEFYEV